MNLIRQMYLGYKYPDLYQKWEARGVEIGDLKLINEKLFARSERFHNACKDLEKMKGALQLKIRGILDSHDESHRRNQGDRIEELTKKGREDLATIARQMTVIKGLREDLAASEGRNVTQRRTVKRLRKNKYS